MPVEGTVVDGTVGEPMLGVVPMTLAPPEALDDPRSGVVPTELPKTLGGVPVIPGVVVTAPGVVTVPGVVAELGRAPGTVLGIAPGTVLGTAPGTVPGAVAPGAAAPPARAPTCAAAGNDESAATIARGVSVR
jgi:hypothetical protein